MKGRDDCVPEAEKKTSKPGRVSLVAALPMVAVLVALSMALLYLRASLAAANLAGKANSRAQIERIASLVATDLALGDEFGMRETIDNFQPVYVEVSTLTGDVVYAGGTVGQEDPRYSAPILFDGQEIGRVRAGPLFSEKLVMPPWGVAILVILSTTIAFVTSYLFAARVSRAVQAVRIDAEVLRSGDSRNEPARRKGGFAEFTQLDQSMRRAIPRVRREAEDLQLIAYRNRQSGLPNFTALGEIIDRHLKTTDFGNPMAIFRLDLDHYDRACESFGSEVGLALLKEAVARIRKELGELADRDLVETSGYFLAQAWADNLFLVLPNISGRGDASAVARALRSAFVAPIRVDNYDVTLGLSGGIVMAPEDGTMRCDLLRRAETALRAVREEGKRGFRFYAPRLDRVASGRAQLEAELREGIENNEFVPYFQPKIDLQTGQIKSCEALARWRRPGDRFISPGAFIPLAEETGLIEKIGQQVLKSACRHAAGWLRAGLAMSLAVNVSPLELRNPNFRANVLAALTETGLPPSYLELEITESVAVEDPKAFQEMLDPLKAMGVRLAVDDFGTGHSNLATLSQLKFDVFKIDRQFVQNLENESSSQPIVEMILAMAQSIGMETVAEGVETPGQARFLRQRGCTYAQGFLYSQAIPAREFPIFLRQWQARRRKRATPKAG